jgi:hypothetical protein
MAFAESRPAQHSQNSRNPFRAGDDFRGFLVHTFATACQIARPPGTDLTASAANGGFYFQAFNEMNPLLDITTAVTGLLC